MERNRSNGEIDTSIPEEGGTAGNGIKKPKKIDPKKRKIYNNTYRLKLKGIRVDAHKKNIYTNLEGEKSIFSIRQVKNLVDLGFVVQLEIS